MANLLVKRIFTSAVAVSTVLAGFAAPMAAHAASAGEVYKTTDGTVWFITKDLQRKPFTSFGAFQSYGFLSQGQIKDADSSVTALPAGSFIAPQDGRIFCATATKGTDVSGECALITGSKKAAFTSSDVFTGQGYSFARAFYGDSSFLEKTTNIDNASAQHRPGTLVNNGGTVQLVVSGGLWGVPSLDVFNAWGWSFADVVVANSADKLLTQTGVIPARVAGELVPTAVTTGDDDNNSPLDGGTGDITVTLESSLSAEEVGEGEEDVEVLGVEIEAGEDSDVDITSVKVEISQNTGADSDDITDYMSEVTVWMGDEMIGSADADDFNEESTVYTKTIALDGGVIRADETEQLTVAVTALDNLDSGDIDTDVFRIGISSIRFIDGDGVTTTDEFALDTEAATGTLDQAFDFVDFATAADVELHVALNEDEDSINESHNIIVDDDDDTDDEPILAFTLEAEGDSDIWVDEIPVLLTTSDSDIATVITSADLYHGDTKVDSQNVDAGATTDTVTFEDIDLTIDEGDTEEFTVKVNIIELTGNYAQGATLNGQVTVASIEAEDQEGEDVASADITGSAIGENASLFSNGITVEVLSAETDITETDVALGDVAEFTWELKITNVGDDDIYVNADNADVVSSSTAADADQIYVLQQSGSNALTALSGTVDSDEDSIAADASAYGGDYSAETFFRIGSGDDITVNIVVSGTNGTAAGQVRAYLSSIEWTTDDITCATACDGTGETINSYTAQIAQDSETPYRPIN